ncbi:MAG: hypothetical protein ACXVDD_25065, partial [Polyangia bacterium]
MRLGMVFAVLIGVNVYFFFLRGGTSLRALMKTTELAKSSSSMTPLVAAQAPAAPVALRPKSDDPSAEEARVVEGTMADSDTVERRWKGDGLSPATVNAIANALGKVFDLRTVRAG